MSTPLLQKRNNYIISNRDFLDDYSNIKSLRIDMTLSGKYLYKYPFKGFKRKNLDSYPSHTDIKILEDTIKSKYNINSKEVVIGSGANGLIQNLIKLFLSKDGNLVTPYLTFNQAEYAASAYGAKTYRVFTKDFKINLLNIDKTINDETKVVYLCNPNNPTGLYLDPSSIIRLSRKYKEVYFIIDESGIEFTKEKSMLDYYFPDNVILVRSFSKAFGLANMRIGYMVCSKGIRELYEKNITVNEFSGVSCDMAYQALKSDCYLKNVDLIIKERNYLMNELAKLDISIIDSKSNIIMTRTCFNSDFINQLINMNVSVVPIYDENNKIHLRIAVQDKKTNRSFIKVMNKIIKCDNIKIGG